MHTIPLAFLWHFSRRHLIALSISVLTLLGFALLLATWPYESISQAAAFMISGTLIILLAYQVAIFCFGSDTDLLTCESSYPAHMLRLPLATHSLAAWPLIIGAASMIGFWLLLWMLVMRPLATLLDTPSFGPSPRLTPMLCIATLAWVQASLWSTYRSALLRSGSALFALAMPLTLTLVADFRGVDQWVTFGLLAAATGVGFVAATYNLRRARSGDAPRMLSFDLESWFPDSLRGSKTRNFGSAAGSQVWYEWRRFCLPICGYLGCWLLFLLMMSINWPESRGIRYWILAAPPMLTTIACFGIGGLNHLAGARQPSIFFTSRPLSSSQFVAAKWASAAICAMVLSLLAGSMFLIAQSLSVGLATWLNQVWQFLSERPGIHGFAGGLILLFAYPLLIWTLLTQALAIKLIGRYWLETFGLFVAVGFAAMILYGLNMQNPQYAPGTITILLAIKFVIGFLTVRTLVRARLAGIKHILIGTLIWAVVVCLSAYALYGLGFYAGSKATLYALGLFAIFWPYSRVGLAPLALHRRRHL